MSNAATAGTSAGVSYRRQASFTTAVPACKSTTVGLCRANPCYVPSSPPSGGAPLPDVGPVGILGAEMAPIALQPESDGTYTTELVVGQTPWKTGGEAVTIQWAHFPGDAAGPGGTITVATPPYVELLSGSAFAAVTTTLSRTQDLTVSWTNDSPPAVLDEVMVDVTSASSQVFCEFSASAGMGVVPAAVLGFLDAGKATYDVHSKEFASETMAAADGAEWVLDFNIDAHARTSYGVATGTVTVQ